MRKLKSNVEIPLNDVRDKDEGLPVCEKCGNLKIWEPFDGVQGAPLDKRKGAENGKVVCPHCQGEIDFLGGEDHE